MTDYNDGKWHGWNGGECPVHPQSDVEIVTGDGKGTDEAGRFTWDRPDVYGNPIVAFRVVKAYREPREWWVNEYPGGAFIYGTKEDADSWARNDRLACVHVREVLE